MRILKQTHHPHALVVQPLIPLHIVLLLLGVLSFTVGGVLEPHST
jgi:hypothetical protein